MKSRSLKPALMAAVLLALTPAAAVAREDVKQKAEDIAEQANDVQQQAGELANEVARSGDERESGYGRDNENAGAATDRDDDGFDWGLLGLLGLAGLLGLTKRDRGRVDTVKSDTRY